MTKKTCLLSFLLIMTCLVSGYAQTFTLKGGLNLSSSIVDDDGLYGSEGLKLNPGLHLGGLIDIPIAKRISVETGLIFSMKGNKFRKEIQNFGLTKSKMDLLYLHVPINARTSFQVGGIKIFATAGPYLAYGLVGRNKYSVTSNGSTNSDKSKVVWADKGVVKRFDAGIGVGTGIEVNSFIIGVNYDLGLVNRNTITTGSVTVKNSVLGVSVGYRFAKK